MRTTRTYPKVCDSCKGAGIIFEPMPTTTSITRMCPACNGSGVITITETIESKDEFNPKSDFFYPVEKER
jgi:DnaJ-class molecular chaperone